MIQIGTKKRNNRNRNQSDYQGQIYNTLPINKKKIQGPGIKIDNRQFSKQK